MPDDGVFGQCAAEALLGWLSVDGRTALFLPSEDQVMNTPAGTAALREENSTSAMWYLRSLLGAKSEQTSSL